MTHKLTILFIILVLIFMSVGCMNNDTETVKPDISTEQIEQVGTDSETDISEEEPEEIEIIMYYTEKDVIALAKVLNAECENVPSVVEKACVAWIACNRVDAGYGDTIYEVLTAPNQFAYNKNELVTEELYNIAIDVLIRWNNEKNGFENVGRVLPSDYLWFRGDGEHNYFRNRYSGNFDIWDYSLDNPYDDLEQFNY